MDGFAGSHLYFSHLKFEIMKESDIKRMGLILAKQAIIEGMKAENKLREDCNQSPAFGYSHFEEVSYEITEIVHKHDDEF